MGILIQNPPSSLSSLLVDGLIIGPFNELSLPRLWVRVKSPNIFVPTSIDFPSAQDTMFIIYLSFNHRKLKGLNL